MKKLLITACGAALIAACAKPTVLIDNAWIRTPAPGMNMTAAYFVLHNRTDASISMIGATSDAYRDVTIHESRVVDGMSEMIRIRSLAVAAGDRVVFKPGGLHFMLRDPVRDLAPGTEAIINIELADGSKLSTVATVGDQAPQ